MAKLELMTKNIENIDTNAYQIGQDQFQQISLYDVNIIQRFLSLRRYSKFVIDSYKRRFESRYGVENAKVICIAACFVYEHPMECWTTQIEIENLILSRLKSGQLTEKIIMYFLNNLKNRRIDFYTVEFIFKCLYHIINKTIL